MTQKFKIGDLPIQAYQENDHKTFIVLRVVGVITKETLMGKEFSYLCSTVQKDDEIVEWEYNEDQILTKEEAKAAFNKFLGE